MTLLATVSRCTHSLPEEELLFPHCLPPPAAVGLPADSAQEDQEAKITSFEEALAKIKDATGVSDIQEVVDRFLNQGNTRRHLEQLQEENSRQLARLREDRERLQATFEDMKYSGRPRCPAGSACWRSLRPTWRTPGRSECSPVSAAYLGRSQIAVHCASC